MGFMPEEIKEMVVKFLYQFPDEQFNIRQLTQHVPVSYPTLLKWISVLEAENRIKVVDYGNVKLVSYNSEWRENETNNRR